MFLLSVLTLAKTQSNKQSTRHCSVYVIASHLKMYVFLEFFLYFLPYLKNTPNSHSAFRDKLCL